MLDPKFLHLMLEHPEVIRRAILTDHQIEWFKVVRQQQQTYGFVTTNLMANVCDVDIRYASHMLFELGKAGYLQGEDFLVNSGEYEHRYIVHPTLDMYIPGHESIKYVEYGKQDSIILTR